MRTGGRGARQETDRTTYHEGGHAIVATFLRQTVVEARYWVEELREGDASDYRGMRLTHETPTFSGSGHIRVSRRSIADADVDSYLLVCLAGTEAEARVVARQTGLPRLQVRRSVYSGRGSSSDMANVASVIGRASMSLEEAKTLARALVDEYWSEIATFAETLRTMKTMTGRGATRASRRGRLATA